ncbi:hypothetical protein E2C01_008521 [Portunus trituberculatus]|uniref:Uncharacterized protein n=1 Tax=Portunus trituberculatus TaxID=210409 RepID=A0A5B7D3D0_PORTR|nr:hypothetical protein [Portunus trituberculatus]
MSAAESRGSLFGTPRDSLRCHKHWNSGNTRQALMQRRCHSQQPVWRVTRARTLVWHHACQDPSLNAPWWPRCPVEGGVVVKHARDGVGRECRERKTSLEWWAGLEVALTRKMLTDVLLEDVAAGEE